MPYDVTVNNKNMPKGHMLGVSKLGQFPNGETTTIEDEQASQYERLTGKKVTDLKGSVTVKKVSTKSEGGDG